MICMLHKLSFVLYEVTNHMLSISNGFAIFILQNKEFAKS